MGNSPDDRAERRKSERSKIWYPVTVTPEGCGSMPGASHNVSAAGMLVLVRTPVEIGVQMRIEFELPEGPLAVSARVVRVQLNRADPHGLWPHQLAVEFDAPLAGLETSLLEATRTDTE